MPLIDLRYWKRRMPVLRPCQTYLCRSNTINKKLIKKKKWIEYSVRSWSTCVINFTIARIYTHIYTYISISQHCFKIINNDLGYNLFQLLWSVQLWLASCQVTRRKFFLLSFSFRRISKPIFVLNTGFRKWI